MWQVNADILAGASAAQRRLLDPVRHVWVSAHAGTGKTETLTRRVVALLLADAKLSPRDILALTYTRAGAGELRVRLPERVASWVRLDDAARRGVLADILGRAATDDEVARLLALPKLLRDAPLWVTTIHGLCSEILGRFPVEAEVRPGFTVLTEAAQDALLEEAQREVLRKPNEAIAGALDVLVGELGDQGVRDLVRLVRDAWDKLVSVISGAQAEGGIDAVLRRAAEGMTEARALELAGEDKDALARWREILRASDKVTDSRIAANLEAALQRGEDWDAWEDLWWNDKGDFKQLGGTKAVKDALTESGTDLRIAEVRAKVLAWRTHNRTAEGYKLTQHLLVWVAQVRRAYAAAKQVANALDYHDLIAHTARLVAGWDAAKRAWVMEQLDRDIRHILLDEGQDNSHVQNEIIRALAGELVKAGGARTLLAVGDVKQSIYRFQGAAPARFTGLRDWLKEEADEALVVGELAHSFRSSAAILRVADVVGAAVTAGEIVHHSVRPEAAGWAVRRPLVLVPREGFDKEHRWLLAAERQRLSGRAVALGEAVADEIDALVGHKVLASTDKAASYADVMLLVKRKDTGSQLAGVLAARGIPVKLGWQGKTLPLMVRDVLALAGVLMAPGDRQRLGQVLVSPLVGWGQDKLSTWAFGGALGADVERWLAEQRAVLLDEGVLAWLVRMESPALLAAWAGGMGGKIEVVQAWWRTLVASAVEAKGVQAWLEQVRAEGLPGMVSPDEDAVRICTIHGAKGLEAPVVILPETTFALGKMHKDEKLVWDEGASGPVGVWFYRGGKVGEPAYQARLREAEEMAVRGDEARMLYVAVTRAKEGLVVMGSASGSEDKRAEVEAGEHWYGQLAGVVANEPLVRGTHVKVMRQAVKVEVPAWLEEVVEAPMVADEGDTVARAFGVQVHAALQGDWRVTDALALTEAAAVREALPEIFESGSVELDVAMDGKLKRLDRVVVRGDEVWVIDFKTDRMAAGDVAGVRPAYVAQVAGYVAAVRAGFGEDKKVRGAVVYTVNPALLWVA